MRSHDRANQIAVEPVLETEEEGVQKWADEQGCAILAFVAPYSGVRLSPISEGHASIGVQEEFGIESFIEKCNQARIRRLELLVNSTGGGVVSSYKVARALGSQFATIRVFVPHVAASGGTLLALIGNEIVMGIMSHLSPLDPQVVHRDHYVSGNVFTRVFERFTDQFGTLTPGELPAPVRCMIEKLDPIIMEEMCGAITTCLGYVSEILEAAGYDKETAMRKAIWLATNFVDHTTVLHRDILANNGFKVVRESQYRKEWGLMRQWLKSHIARPECTHHMRYCLPRKKTRPEQTATQQAAPTASRLPRNRLRGRGARGKVSLEEGGRNGKAQEKG